MAAPTDRPPADEQDEHARMCFARAIEIRAAGTGRDDYDLESTIDTLIATGMTEDEATAEAQKMTAAANAAAEAERAQLRAADREAFKQTLVRVHQTTRFLEHAPKARRMLQRHLRAAQPRACERTPGRRTATRSRERSRARSHSPPRRSSDDLDPPRPTPPCAAAVTHSYARAREASP